MRAITISREYGAGGHEVAEGLAKMLGWELLDRELLHQAAALEDLPDVELEAWDEKAVGLVDRIRIHPRHERYMRGLSEAARLAVARGNVVLVGRGTRQLLGDAPEIFHLRLEASPDWRARRIARIEGLSQEEATVQCSREDQTRGRFTRYFFGEGTSEPVEYDLVVNMERSPIDDVVACVASLARGHWSPDDADVLHQRRVLTMTGEAGAGTVGLAWTLADRLALTVHDRRLLENEAARLGVGVADLEKVDEQPPGIVGRLISDSLSRRYFETLKRIMDELADRGDVLIVGRGGSRFLEGNPRAFHLRLVASPATRLRRIMEHYWLAEDAARALIDRTDARRRRFHHAFFGVDWADPLGYHGTVNTDRLGPAVVDLVAFLAGGRWAREGGED